MIHLPLALTQPGHEDSACWCACGGRGAIFSNTLGIEKLGWEKMELCITGVCVLGGGEVSNGEKGTGGTTAERAFAGPHLLFLLPLPMSVQQH